MGYVEKVMGDNEYMVYLTHRHYIVLFQRLISSLFTFLVFLALGLVILVPRTDEAGNTVRFVVGVIALGSLILPAYLIVSAWLEGLRGQEFVERIWRALLAGILILVVSLIMLLKPQFWPVGWIAVVIAVVPGLELVRIVLDWLNERYIITNWRVIEVRGIINKHVRDSALEKVNDVDMNQSIVGRLLGYGTVQIITGSDIGVNMFRRISNPVRFKREMLNAKERLHEASAAAEPEEPAPAGPPVEAGKAAVPAPDSAATANIPNLIVELAKLHEQGILSEEEFQGKKKELLDRL
jgi:hypothetical protein